MGHLTSEQRYKIEVLYKEKYAQSTIAKIIGKDKSVICRELKRNSDKRDGVYNGELAVKKCADRHKKKHKKIHLTKAIESYIIYWIKEDYSPEQLVGLAKKEGLECVSVERIYQYLWKDKKQGGKLFEHLRTQGKRYRKRGATKDKRGQIVGKVSIEERPTIVDAKNRFGDLEMDLVIGKNHKGALLTINDRLTGMIKMTKVPSKESIEIENATIRLLQDWKPFLHTITSDNGKEFARHQSIAEQLNIKYFFAHPYHSWERGANENLNGLVRQYFPKKHDFTTITEQQIQNVQDKLNNRPRKRFRFLTPKQLYLQTLINNGLKVAFIT